MVCVLASFMCKQLTQLRANSQYISFHGMMLKLMVLLFFFAIGAIVNVMHWGHLELVWHLPHVTMTVRSKNVCDRAYESTATIILPSNASV